MNRDTAETLHAEAVRVVQRYRKCEFELIEVLQKVDTQKIYYTLGYNSLFKYATSGLCLSEEVAYIFISVARKAKKVPALKEEIQKGDITISKAKRLVPVLNDENQSYWLDLAKKSTKRELERQVAIESPKTAVPEKLDYVSVENEVSEKITLHHLPEVRVQLQVGISEDLMKKLKRAQDIESQRRQSAATLENTISSMVDLYLIKMDPLEKAKRQNLPKVAKLGPGQVKVPCSKGKNLRVNRAPMNAALKHQLNLKFQRQCGHVDVKGVRCSERRFLHIHHKVPVSHGGKNDIHNLELLCFGHHASKHRPAEVQ